MKIVIILALFAIGTMGLPAPLGENDPTGVLNNAVVPQPTPGVAQSAGNLVASLIAAPGKFINGVRNLNQNQYPNIQRTYPTQNPMDPFGIMGGVGGIFSAPMSYLPFYGMGNQPNPGQMLQNTLKGVQNGQIPPAQGVLAVQYALRTGQIAPLDAKVMLDNLKSMHQQQLLAANAVSQQSPLNSNPSLTNARGQLLLTNGP